MNIIKDQSRCIASRIQDGRLEAPIVFCPGMDQVTVTTPSDALAIASLG